MTTPVRLAIAVALFGSAVAGEAPSSVLHELGFDDDQIAAIRSGEIVTVVEPKLETDKAELAVAGAMLVDAPVAHFVDVMTGVELFRVDRTILGAGRIDPASADRSLADAVLQASEVDEIEAFLRADVGSDFNLHESDVEVIRRLAAGNEEPAQAAAEAYRAILARRIELYLTRGLEGVLPYTRRKGKETDHAAELAGIPFTTSVIADLSPDLVAYLQAFPRSENDAVEERYYWVKHDVADRPAFSLLHWAFTTAPDHAVLIEREFYVSHTYNAQQAHIAVLPHEERTLVVYVSHLFTDRVTGIGSSIAHRVGRGKVADAVRRRLEMLRAAL